MVELWALAARAENAGWLSYHVCFGIAGDTRESFVGLYNPSLIIGDYHALLRLEGYSSNFAILIISDTICYIPSHQYDCTAALDERIQATRTSFEATVADLGLHVVFDGLRDVTS